MNYPIFDENRTRIGTLHTRRDGLYMLFEARLPRAGALTRLYLHGGGETRLLGLMEPCGGALLLRRRLSRAQLPPHIEYAATSEKAFPGACAARTVEAPPTRDGGAWRNVSGGLFNPSRRLLALPCALRRPDSRIRRETINGREYIVFKC